MRIYGRTTYDVQDGYNLSIFFPYLVAPFDSIKPPGPQAFEFQTEAIPGRLECFVQRAI
jgi:hypothetical protein